jgi:hypothetical protein
MSHFKPILIKITPFAIRVPPLKFLVIFLPNFVVSEIEEVTIESLNYLVGHQAQNIRTHYSMLSIRF